MIGLTDHHSYYFYQQSTDMRKGFDGLSGLVRDRMGSDPLNGSVYLFINRRRDRMKMLVWESGGFMLYYKRLESGTFELPNQCESDNKIRINWETLMLMIRGIRLKKVVKRKRYEIA
jgi:transposase